MFLGNTINLLPCDSSTVQRFNKILRIQVFINSKTLSSNDIGFDTLFHRILDC